MRIYVLLIIILITALQGFTQPILTATVDVIVRPREIVLLDIAPSNTNIGLDLLAPSEAGEGLISTKDNSKWLNFTSAVKINQTRKITVRHGGSMPSGVLLKLNVANYSGSGAGALGSPVAIGSITSNPLTIIDGIGGAYTGNGINNGYQLSYELEIDDLALLKAQTSTISIIYTLVDN